MNKTLFKYSPFYKKFQDQINTFQELSKGDRVIVSVSGGLDSITLLLLLHELDYFNLVVVHVNHKMRIESDHDEIFVKELCDDLRVPFYQKSLEPKKRNKKHSIEEWARNERYSFLNDIIIIKECKWIMTAHHKNDQVETILMNLSRQTGVNGLRGIAKERDKILRPMLEFSKKDIRDFAKKVGYGYCEDLTNLDTSIPRNFLRHNILMPWEKESPEVINGISKSSKYFKEWRDGLDYLILKFIFPSLETKNENFLFPINILRENPNLIRMRLIQLMTDEGNDQWSKHSILMLNQFLDKSTTGDFHFLHNGWRILHDRDTFIIQKSLNIVNKESVKLYLDTPVFHNNYKYVLELVDKKISPSRNKDKETLDWSKLRHTQLEIRLWEAGDTFQPLGMNGRQKISDFLINEKVDRLEKESQSVLTANGKIVWVCGKRISDWAKITKNTKKIAILSRNLISS